MSKKLSSKIESFTKVTLNTEELSVRDTEEILSFARKHATLFAPDGSEQYLLEIQHSYPDKYPDILGKILEKHLASMKRRYILITVQP